jgi:SH3-like domain-containing protein
METGTQPVVGPVIEGIGSKLDRRRMLRLAAGIGAAAVLGGKLAGSAGATSGSTHFRTTSALNLRAKPSISAKILAVIPNKTIVESLFQSSNGFNKVKYNGIVGWAYGQYLASAIGDDDPDVTWLGMAKTTTAVNFRFEPNLNSTVITVLAKGAQVEISDWVLNGYRYVDRQGTRGWIYDAYLQLIEEEGPITFKTTTAVNLRAKPSTSAKILKVVPAGAMVIDYDLVMANGFRGVDYNGAVGWIYDAYLKRA